MTNEEVLEEKMKLLDGELERFGKFIEQQGQGQKRKKIKTLRKQDGVNEVVVNYVGICRSDNLDND